MDLGTQGDGSGLIQLNGASGTINTVEIKSAAGPAWGPRFDPNPIPIGFLHS